MIHLQSIANTVQTFVSETKITKTDVLLTSVALLALTQGDYTSLALSVGLRVASYPFLKWAYKKQISVYSVLPTRLADLCAYNDRIMTIFQRGIRSILLQFPLSPNTASLIQQVICGPILEEMINRYVIQEICIKNIQLLFFPDSLGAKITRIALSALIGGLKHFHYESVDDLEGFFELRKQAIQQGKKEEFHPLVRQALTEQGVDAGVLSSMITGIGYATAMEISHSLSIPILLHSLNNLISLKILRQKQS